MPYKYPSRRVGRGTAAGVAVRLFQDVAAANPCFVMAPIASRTFKSLFTRLSIPLVSVPKLGHGLGAGDDDVGKLGSSLPSRLILGLHKGLLPKAVFHRGLGCRWIAHRQWRRPPRVLIAMGLLVGRMRPRHFDLRISVNPMRLPHPAWEPLRGILNASVPRAV